MIYRRVDGVGPCAFYVYMRGLPHIKVKSPYWETTFYRRGDDDAPIWENPQGPSTPDHGLWIELEQLFQESKV